MNKTITAREGCLCLHSHSLREHDVQIAEYSKFDMKIMSSFVEVSPKLNESKIANILRQRMRELILGSLFYNYHHRYYLHSHSFSIQKHPST